MHQPVRTISFFAVVTIGIYLIITHSTFTQSSLGDYVSKYKNGTCEEQGLYPRKKGDSDPYKIVDRVVIRVTPDTSNPGEEVYIDNQISKIPFHPTLSSQFSTLFPGTISNVKPHRLDKSKSQCIEPISHSIPILDPPPLRPGETNLFFAFTTTPERATQFSSVWSHFLASPSPKFNSQKLWYFDDQPPKPPGCLVIDARGRDDPRMAIANIALKKAGTGCVMKNGSRNKERYEMRVLGLIKDAFEESELRRFQEGPGATKVEWFIFGDDDTWWFSQESIREITSQYDWREDHILGGFSEAEGNFQDHGRIAYGGAGIILSRNLVRKMQGILETCADRYDTIFGGDGLITNCASLAKGVRLDNAVTEIAGLNQMDFRGDASGFLSSGLTPFISLHHWVGWCDLIPGRQGIEVIGLLRLGAEAMGGNNLLRRFIWDEGRVTWSAGYSIIVHREALSDDDVLRTEHTWVEFQPRRPSRSVRIEGTEKLTYYITAVEKISETVSVFTHTCSHPSVEHGLNQIDIIWDTTIRNGGNPSWIKSHMPLKDGLLSKESEKLQIFRSDKRRE